MCSISPKLMIPPIPLSSILPYTIIQTFPSCPHCTCKWFYQTAENIFSLACRSRIHQNYSKPGEISTASFMTSAAVSLR